MSNQPNPTLGDLIKENLIYTKHGKKYKMVGRENVIKKGAMHSFKGGELQSVCNPETIGDTPANFSLKRKFYNPI